MYTCMSEFTLFVCVRASGIECWMQACRAERDAIELYGLQHEAGVQSLQGRWVNKQIDKQTGSDRNSERAR